MASCEIRHGYRVATAKVIVQRLYSAVRLTCEDGFSDGEMFVDRFSNAIDLTKLHEA